MANKASSIFTFLSFEQILILDVIRVFQSNNIVFCGRFRMSSPIGITKTFLVSQALDLWIELFANSG